MSERMKRLRLNTISSLIFQITTLICGFIVPWLILNYYGSEVNGLVNSITQFLQVIAFLELGVGAVVQSALYKPLSDNDNKKISEIIRSANRFFKKIGIILTIYIIILFFVYPHFVDGSFEYFYIGTLIVSLGISSFAQYFFGVVDRLLLTADQRGYIQYTAQATTMIVNTICCAVLIHFGASIHFVKLATSIIYLVRPAVLRIYVKQHYRIDRHINYSVEPLKQKWNGIAQHVASVVLDQTDVIVLTFFSTLKNVSIYSVYHLVIYGVKNLFLSLTNGIQSLMGEYLAREDYDELNSLFDWAEWLIHTGCTIIFGCTTVLIVPFISVYTKGLNDPDYLLIHFAVLITIAHAGHCLRLPYNLLILAAGHYKQTQSNYIIAAVMNILISIITVKVWGLIGVAVGTLCAMAYQTIWMAIYDSKHILKTSVKSFYKHLLIDLIVVIVSTLSTFWIQMKSITYINWLILAIIVFMIWGVVSICINYIFYKDKVKILRNRIIMKMKRR